MDFLQVEESEVQRDLLTRAAEYARSKCPVALEASWFNNQPLLWLSPEVHEKISREAEEQDEVVFGKPGLEVLAAPWKFAICTKIARIKQCNSANKHPPEYDYTDAVSYLRQYLRQTGGQPVPMLDLQAWATEYHMELPLELIREVGKQYYRQWKSHGIVESGIM